METRLEKNCAKCKHVQPIEFFSIRRANGRASSWCDEADMRPVGKAQDISIATICREDAEALSDRIRVLQGMVAASDDNYPGIESWFSTKVVPGLRSGERKAYLAFGNDNEPAAAAILKLGKSAKICHLRVSPNYQDSDVGQVLFMQMILDSLSHAQEIHFTLPEGLWQKKSGFFRSFGFCTYTETKRQYRIGETELSCSAPIGTAYSAVLRKLPGLLQRFWP